MIRVFISHSSKDVAFAKGVIDLLCKALALPAVDILCTSVPGHRLPPGAQTNEEIRREVLATPVFIGLITKAGLASTYVLFELGARWGAGKQLIPLLPPGVSPSVLEGPIAQLNAVTCGAADLHDLIAQVGKGLNISPQPPGTYSSELEILTTFPPEKWSEGAQIGFAPSVPQQAVDQLAELRSEAVHEILNRPVHNDAEFAALDAYTKKWWARVNDVLEKNFTKAEQLNFSRLGAVPTFVFPHQYNDRHAKILREYVLQERRLLDIIARHTR